MLLELRINNFALIDKVELQFAEGLNILTGETGAGKSILIDSVNFILGEKQGKDIIRTGQESAYVEGVFEVGSEEVSKLLQENGIETDDIIVLSREINQSGRSVSRVNGKTVTIGQLKQLGRLLIDIHGQHEHQSLLHDESHIDILDSFCGESLSNLKEEYRNAFNSLKEIEKKIEKLAEDEQYKLRRIDLLKFQIQEISDAKLKANEYEELVTRRDILVNSEKIYSALSLAYQKLYEGYENDSAYDEIGTSIKSMEGVSSFDIRLNEIKEGLEDIYYKLQDSIESIRDYRDSVEFNQAELDEIEMRLDLINRLKRKYGNSVEEILEYFEKIEAELSQIERSEEIIDELNREKEKLLVEVNKIAESISQVRRDIGGKLGEYIEKELKYLGMERAIFKVEVEELEKLNENGKDKVYFKITANPGEPLRSLSKVASGGEMSRIMLAIKSVIADIDEIPTLIFDEIDTGISGRTAQSVAEKMALISNGHQILCVTHLPQIASMADMHFKIQKFVENDVTTTKVFKLQIEEQTNELARMLGGAIVTELTRNHSKEMLLLAKELKNKIRR